MLIHTLKIKPNSEAEQRFMELLQKVEVKPEAVLCRLGSVFGVPYNEYLISDGLYKQIQHYLEREKGLSH